MQVINGKMTMKEHIQKCLEAFSDGTCHRVEIVTTGDPKKFRKYFYNAMRRRGLYWLTAIEGSVMHVTNPPELME